MRLNAGTYEIIIEAGSIAKVGQYAAEAVKPCRTVVVSDDNVYPLYGKTVEDSLTGAGFDVAQSFVFPHGEEQKNLRTFSEILEHLAAEHLTRTDVIFALGGGVTGDMTGFAAACYLRGIKFVQIPTSLLAMVDSSVGGKTAVDLSAGKNLVGAFHEPALVVCDPDTLSTLPADFFTDGMAEAIKMGMLGNRPLFDGIRNHTLTTAEIIEMCVTDKRDIVSRDFKDNGERQKLNLGHTVGHALEVLSDYTIRHGHAVAAGMHVITKACAARGLCSDELLTDLDDTLRAAGLDPMLCSRHSVEDLHRGTLHDKKLRGNTMSLVIPREIGVSELMKFTTDELTDIIRLGIAE
ncbi:MAG: 3-dehydroquinate synthase [Clostridia bacterium]|nr:3-dehydroquinate synthase [Clostridia bacterium]